MTVNIERVGVDYLVATFPHFRATEVVWNLLRAEMVEQAELVMVNLGVEFDPVEDLWKEVKISTGVPYYREAYRNEAGTVTIAYKEGMGLYVRLTGGFWQTHKASPNVGYDRDINICRIDLASDFTMSFDADDAVRMAEARARKSKTKFASFIDKTGSTSGCTVGSRSSETYTRLYDKRLEQRLSPDEIDSWWRIEVELKGKQAKRAWENPASWGEVVARAALSAGVDAGSRKWYAGLAGGYGAGNLPLPSIKYGNSKSGGVNVRYAMTHCLPYLLRTLGEHPELVSEVVAQIRDVG